MAEANLNPPASGAGGSGKDEPAAANGYATVSFEIEFATKQNNSVSCPITRRTYRGRWDNGNVKARVADDRFATCPIVPGHRIKFNGKERSVEVYDPLSTREFRDTLKELKETVRQQFAGTTGEPDESVVYAKLSDDRLKQWCYWARRWLDQGCAERVSGGVPEMDAVEKMPGRVERNTFDTSARRDKFPVEVPQYIPPGKAQKV
jgi:hypothetical protein